MGDQTSIAWADSTFNPWIGCQKISPGCDGCYAEALMDKRMGRVKWGAGQSRQRTSEAYWRQPLAWNKKAAASGRPWRVFCGSLCDVFDNEVPCDWRYDLFDLFSATPNLTWMLLTKRISNAAWMLPWTGDDVDPAAEPPGNVWLGATVVNQEEANRDVPKLLAVPATVRFLSLEPMLGPINFRWRRYAHQATGEDYRTYLERNGSVTDLESLRGIDWVIVGGESDQSGHKARPLNIAWARDIVQQSREARVACFVKQIGSAPRGWCAWNAPEHIGHDAAAELRAEDVDGNCCNHEAHEQAQPCWFYGRRCMAIEDRAGADPSEWPADLRVREFPR